MVAIGARGRRRTANPKTKQRQRSLGNVLAVSNQHVPPTRDTEMREVNTEIRNEAAMATLDDKPREEFHAFNNNNDSKYLHKKFKKMAVAAAAAQPVVVVPSREDHRVSKTTMVSERGASSSRSEASPASSGEASDCSANASKSKFGVVVRDSETATESNVQINHKDYVNSDGVSRDNCANSSNDRIVNNETQRETCNASPKDANNSGSGRHVCPYCKLCCAKPSVLQKHIRAHTNERPYPCVPCGFAFKTKSNLYKHCRSRSHALRLHGSEDTPNNDEDWSLGSETDVSINASKSDSAWSSSDKTTSQAECLGLNDNSASDSISPGRMSPSGMTNSQLDSKPKTIYKPKFHKASLYQEEDAPNKSVLPPNPEFLNKHISKIISENEAIVDTIDTPLHRKYNKDNCNQRQVLNETANICLNPLVLLKNETQPLNLTKSTEHSESSSRKRCFSESFIIPDLLKSPQQHPLNPEGSIIKDLLLKASGLFPITSETYDVSETLYVCSLCQISYKSSENLEIHKLYYCKGVPSSSHSVVFNGNTNDVLRLSRPETFVRSNSINVTLPETISPNALIKKTNSIQKSPSRRINKPENLVILKNEHLEVSAPLPSPGPLLGNTRLVDTQTSLERSRRLSFVGDDNEKISRISPTMKRRSEIQTNESFSKIKDENYRSEIYSPPSKIRCTETPTTLRSLEELSMSPMRQNATSLQMFGGEVKIVDNAGGTTTMRIESSSQHSPTLISQSRTSPIPQGPETSSIVVRSGLHSGATIVHNPPTPKEPLPSPHPQTPRLLASITPNISTPNIIVPGIPAPNMSKFQFPIGSITAYNPLTLPPLSPVASPSGVSTILHGGKLIPYVPGMPGPNTLNAFSPSLQKSFKVNSLDNTFHDSVLLRNDKNPKEKLKALEIDYNHKIADKQSQVVMTLSNMHNLNHNGDKKEILNKCNNNSKIIPTIKVNFEDPSVSLKTNRNSNVNFNKRMAQIKIDEIVRQNTEILQKNFTSPDFNLSKSPRSEYNKSISPHKLEKRSDHLEKNIGSKILEKEKRQSYSATEMKQFNFENLISKSEIPVKPLEVVADGPSTNQIKSTVNDNSLKNLERSETSYFKKTIGSSNINSIKNDSQNAKFLRPSTLPLKPGTFTPKKHHGITPNANTLPLISPETPRPAKAYGQLYLNGHAYTYLGLKCSTKVYYCTLNRPQPTYVPNQHALSMYSNWQVCSESTPHPLGLSPGQAMNLYDSRHRPQNITIARIKQDHLMTHSSQWTTKVTNKISPQTTEETEEIKVINNEASSASTKNLTGGFESNEDYTYVRGRGRGRYVCSECGIRCKKPSMLKKHIRTHTDVRPFTCKHCAFSFKTKGNLTKHMKSKAHYRKCCELGINPSEGIDGTDITPGLGESEDDSESEDDGNEGETESSDTDSCKSRLEHEAAHCLLSLSGGRPAPGLLSTARPTTYPYTPSYSDAPSVSDESKFLDMPTTPVKETHVFVGKQSLSQSNIKYDKSMCARQGNIVSCPIDLSKPRDFNKSELKDYSGKYERTLVFQSAEEILTPVGEPDLLASLASSSERLPRINNWNEGEPMLQAYLTEKALQDSRIKQCQYTNGKLRQPEIELDSSFTNSFRSTLLENSLVLQKKTLGRDSTGGISSIIIQPQSKSENFNISDFSEADNSGIQTLAEIAANSVRLKTPPVSSSNDKKIPTSNYEKTSSTENAKFVAFEYLKSVCGKANSNTGDLHANTINKTDKINEIAKPIANVDESTAVDKESDLQKINADHIGVARKVVVGAGGVGFKLTPPNDSQVAFSKGQLTEDGRSVCGVCNKTFSKTAQLRLHINIHYIERPFRCSACAVSFRTRGHLQKHERSGSHHNKVSMTSTFGAATTTNPRPFKCSDCKIAFRIHGHLAKHLRSKMHVMKLECLGKLPFGTFAEIERAGISLTDIDTTDCDNSLASLQILAQKLHEKDPSKLEKWIPTAINNSLLQGTESSDDEDLGSSSAQNVPMENDCKTVNDSDSTDETSVKFSATNT